MKDEDMHPHYAMYDEKDEDAIRYHNIMHELVKLPLNLQISIRDWLVNNPELNRTKAITDDTLNAPLTKILQ